MLMEGSSLPSHTIQARHYILTGHVQGVGFRPFVYRLAHEHDIHGWIENQMGQVVIHAEGGIENLHTFKRRLIEQAPLHASPLFSEICDAEYKHYDSFSIRSSNAAAPPCKKPQPPAQHISPATSERSSKSCSPCIRCVTRRPMPTLP